MCFHVIYIMDDIFCNKKYLFYKFVLFKHCYYCFVRWTVCNLSVCKKVNRQYKHNLSCTLLYHWRPYRRIKVRRPFTIASLEMPQSSSMNLRMDYSLSAFHSSLTGNATIITDDFANGLSPSAFYRGWWKWHNHRRICRRNPVRQHWSAVHNHRQVHWWTVRISKGEALNASLIACRCRRTAKNMEGS